MVLTFTIACKCISQSVALNRWHCTESRAMCSTSQRVSLTHCGLMRRFWKYLHWGDDREWVWIKEWVLCSLHAAVHACPWSCDQMHVWLAFSHVWASFIHPWGVNTEKLSGAALLRVYTEWQRWHFPRAEPLQTRRLLPRCRHRSRPLSESPLPPHRRRYCCKHFCFLFYKTPREEIST